MRSCLRCGYNLTGLPEEYLCPECGYAYDDSSEKIEFGKQTSSWAELTWGLVWALLACRFAVRHDWMLASFLGLGFLIPVVRVLRRLRNSIIEFGIMNRTSFDVFGGNHLILSIPWSDVARVQDDRWWGKTYIVGHDGRLSGNSIDSSLWAKRSLFCPRRRTWTHRDAWAQSACPPYQISK